MTLPAEWGPFFATHVHDVTPAPPWRPLRELLDDPAVLHDRVAGVRAYLAAGRDIDAVPARVAASVTQLGIAARVVSPSLGSAVHSGRFPTLDDAWWQPAPGGVFPLSITANRTDSPAELIAWLGRLVDAVARFSVSRTILWGNVASAVNGAAVVIGTPRAAELAAGLLARPPLRGTATWPAGRFRRRSCCLIYRATNDRSAVCGDCVLGTS